MLTKRKSYGRADSLGEAAFKTEYEAWKARRG
jgi:hypothetical protein